MSLKKVPFNQKRGKRHKLDELSAELESIQKRGPRPLVKNSEPKPTAPAPMNRMQRIDRPPARSPPQRPAQDEEIYELSFEEDSAEDDAPRENPLLSLEDLKKQIALENARAKQRENEEDAEETTLQDPPAVPTTQLDLKLLNVQAKRNQELLQFLERGHESFTLFELLPTTKQEQFLQNLHKQALQHRKVHTADDAVEKDTQTEEIHTQQQATQWPGERGISENCAHPETGTLKKFARRVLPVIETLLEENLPERGARVTLPNKEQPQQDFVSSQISLPVLTAKFAQRFPEASFTVKNLLFFPKKRNLLCVVHCLGPAGSLLVLWDVQAPRKPSKVLYSESEVTALCVAETSEHIVIAGSATGAILVWDIRESSNCHESYRNEKDKYTLRRPSYSTESVVPAHSAPVEKVTVLPSGDHNLTVISVAVGEVVSWNLFELPSGDLGGSELDLGLRVGSKLKLVKSSSLSLSELYGLRVVEGSAFAVDPADNANFLYGFTDCLLHANMHGGKAVPKQYSVLGDTPSCVAYCQAEKARYFILGLQSGTICLYDKAQAAPLTTWLYVGGPVVRLAWDATERAGFFTVDSECAVSVWDLRKDATTACAILNLPSEHWKALDWVLPLSGKDGVIVATAAAESAVIYCLNVPRVTPGRFQKCVQGLPTSHSAALVGL